MTMRAKRVFVAVCVWLGAGCAALPAAHRGARRADIHAEFERVLVAEGYRCMDSGDLRTVLCTHPSRADINFGYLPASNFVQLYTAFDRANDETMTARWRGGCEAILPELNEMNNDLVIQASCQEDYLLFSASLWVPSAGLRDADFLGITEIFSQAVGEALVKAGVVEVEGAAAPAVPDADPEPAADGGP